jgi:NTE family protein
VIAVALAGGGEPVAAWETGVLAGLADGAVDLRNAAAIVGTSAGALVAARLAAGVDPRDDAARILQRPAPAAAAPASDRATTALATTAPATAGAAPARATDGAAAFAALAAAWQSAGATTQERRRAFGRLAIERSPGGEDALVERIAPQFADDAWPSALRVVAVDADTGDRVVFDARDRIPVARAVAASRAIPSLRPPISIGDRRFIDGALGSTTNADVLSEAPARLVLVLTAVPSDPPADGPERLWLAALRDEVATLERAGRPVVVVQASAEERTAMGPDPLSGATAGAALLAGRRSGRAIVAQIRPRRAA